MKKLGLHNQTDLSYISLPVDFIDIYMPEASGESLKVYLYLLRASSDPSIILSIHDMVDLFDVTQNKIREALLYWEGKHLLSLSYMDGEITDITLLPLPKEPVQEKTYVEIPQEDSAAKALETSLQNAPVETVPLKPIMPVVDMASLYKDENFSELSSLSEAYLGRTLTPTEQNKLATCYLVLNKDLEIVEYLVEHCIDAGHTSFHYIEAVAKNWAEAGFTTLEEIKENSKLRNENVYKILKALGIKRDPVSHEEEYILVWTKNFDLPIILEACNRTMQKTHTPDFNYVNAILNNWRTNQVRTLADVEALDLAHQQKVKKMEERPVTTKNSFNNATERNTDYDKLFAQYYPS